MNPFLHGFTDELVKTSGALKSIGRFAVKHPLVTLTAAGTVATTGLSAGQAYRQGLRGGEKPRYLAAGVDRGGNATTSPAAYTNYHEMLERRPSSKEIKSLSKYYDPKKFRR